MPHDIVIFSFESEVVSHGPIAIGSHLLEHGYTVKIVNYTSMYHTYETLPEVVEKYVVSEKQVVGFSLTFAVPRDRWAIDLIIKNCIKRFPKIHFIFGGYGSLFPHLRPSKQMHFVIGQNDENKAVQVLNSITGKIQYKPYDFYSQKLHIDELYKDDLSYLTSFQYRMGFIEFRKKCLFTCSFCAHSADNRSPTAPRTKEQIIEHMEHQHKLLKTNTFFIINQTFNESEENFRFMTEVSEALSFRPAYVLYLRIELTRLQKNSPLIRDFYNKYVHGALMGLESLNPVSLKAVNKAHDVAKLKESVLEFKQMYPHMLLTGIFVLGLPGFRPKKDMAEVIQWVEETRAIDAIKVSDLDFRPLHRVDGNNATAFEMNPEKYGYHMDQKGNWYHDDGFTKEEVTAEFLEAERRLDSEGVGMNGSTFPVVMRKLTNAVPYGTPNYLPDV